MALADVGLPLHAFVAELLPLVRSITGDGLRETLQRIGQRIPLTLHEVLTGTPVFDWAVPKEWNVSEAYVVGPDGRRVIDLRNHPLHLMGYSAPIRARMSLAELKPHLFSIPDRPEWIPYRTSYYQERWGFCLAHNELLRLADGDYDVVIDATLADGAMTYGECFLPGTSEREILFSCHVCHPGLANDNLAGIAVATELAARLATTPHRYGYRFVFAPGTIGAIAWLALNEANLAKIDHGLVLAMLGDGGPLTYKRSRRHGADVDRAAILALKESGQPYAVEDFSPYGYDERQFNSPGIDLPVGRLTRTPHGKFPEYHTSADDLDLVRPASLADALDRVLRVVAILEGNARYQNLSPKCEPQLGRRGLFRAIGGHADPEAAQLALLWVLNLSDGDHDLLDIAERSGLSFATVRAAADALRDSGLLSESLPP